MSAEDAAGMDALGERLVQAYNTGDVQGVLNCYTDDCCLIFAGTGLIRGVEGNRQAVTESIGNYDKFTLEHIERSFSGDMCAEIGNFSFYNEGKELFKGMYNITALKQNGEWKIKYDTDVCIKILK